MNSRQKGLIGFPAAMLRCQAIAVPRAGRRIFEKAEGIVGGGGRFSGVNPDTGLKGLQLELTMEDPKVFTAPLTALVTYRRLNTEWQEQVCADNPVEHYKDEWIGLPKADHPDF
jgi:hypothetical protein